MVKKIKDWFMGFFGFGKSVKPIGVSSGQVVEAMPKKRKRRGVMGRFIDRFTAGEKTEAQQEQERVERLRKKSKRHFVRHLLKK